MKNACGSPRLSSYWINRLRGVTPAWLFVVISTSLALEAGADQGVGSRRSYSGRFRRAVIANAKVTLTNTDKRDSNRRRKRIAVVTTSFRR